MAILPLCPAAARLNPGKQFRRAAYGASRRRPLRRALTLIELLISVLILGILGLVTQTLLFSVVQNTRSTSDSRRANLRLEILSQRVDARVRGASKVLNADAQWIALWTGDTRPDNLVNLSELCIFRYNSGAGALSLYTPRTDLTSADDFTYDDAETFTSLVSGIAANPLFSSSVVAQNLTRCTFRLDNAAITSARAIQYDFEINSTSGKLAGVRTVALRGQ